MVGLLAATFSPDLIELACAGGFDWMLIDQEHSQIHGPRDLVQHLRAAELYDVMTIVKLNGWDPMAARDALDAGALGIQVPFVENAAMLREVLSECRFRPKGRRGYCPVGRATRYDMSPTAFDAYIELQNEHVIVIPSIESETAIENLDEILAIPDCPIVAIGPDDLRMSLGLTRDHESEVYLAKVVRAVAKKINAAGKLNMMPTYVPDDSNRDYWVEMINTLHNDLPYTTDGACMAFAYAAYMKLREAAKRRDPKKE